MFAIFINAIFIKTSNYLLKGIVHPPKNENSFLKSHHHLLTLNLFQTCVSFFVLLSTK